MKLFQKTSAENKVETTVSLPPQFSSINVDKLKLAPYQRGLRRNRAKNYAENYDPDIFGIILVSYRDGTYWIVDGQHRVECCKIKGIKTVWCQVLEGLTYEEEARKFFKINNDKVRLNANHKFNALVEEKNPMAIGIVNALDKYGFRVSKEGNERTENCINAVGSLQKIYITRSIDSFCDIFEILRKVWNGDKDSLRADMIKGLNTFLSNYECDKNFLIKVLEADTPLGILNRAKAYTNNIRRPSDGTCFHVAKTIRDMYDDMAMSTHGKFSVCSYKLK